MSILQGIDVVTLFSLWLFIIFMVATPGPANLLIMSVGVRSGFWAAMPFNLGLITGKLALNIAMAFGLGLFLQQYPMIQSVLKYVSAAFMIYLAFQNWHPANTSKSPSNPPGFLSAIWVHPLNPKAWVMSILAWTEFGPALGSWTVQLALIPVSFLVAQLIFHSLWALSGKLLSASLSQSVILSRCLVLLTVAVVLIAIFS